MDMEIFNYLFFFFFKLIFIEHGPRKLPPPVPYFLPSTSRHLSSLVFGRRKAIEVRFKQKFYIFKIVIGSNNSYSGVGLGLYGMPFPLRGLQFQEQIYYTMQEKRLIQMT